MATQTSRGSASSAVARLIALCLAVFFGYILFFHYGDEIQAEFANNPEPGLPVTNTQTAPDEAANPALAACVQQRVGDVEKMREEGILSDAQYTSFRSRAEELCIQQHSG